MIRSRAGGPQRSERGSQRARAFRDQEESRGVRDWRALSSSDSELRPVRPKSGRNVRRLSKRVPEGIAIGEGLKNSLAAKKATASPYQRPSPRKGKVVTQVELGSPVQYTGRYYGVASARAGRSRARNDAAALNMIASQMGAASLGLDDGTEATAAPQPQPAQALTPVPTPPSALAARRPPPQRLSKTHDVLDEIARKMGATSLKHDDEGDTTIPAPQSQSKPVVAPNPIPAPPSALAARPSRTKVHAPGTTTVSSTRLSHVPRGEPVASGSGSH